MASAETAVRAPRGTVRSCRGWPQEAALRCLMNNLDAEVAEAPERLVVYGGTGKAARDWASYHAIVAELQRLGDEETLLVASGKPVGVLQTHARAPRVLIANANLVPRWATWEHFWELERAGLTMYGQMTAGSWIYIGSQGIIQGTYETLAALAAQHFGGSLAGRIVLTGGLGGMGGAQPLAVAMNDGIALCVEADPARARRRVDAGFCDRVTADPAEALRWVESARKERRPESVALIGNCAVVLPDLARQGFQPDVVTDQTSAHDPLHGYIAPDTPADLRERDPAEYVRRAQAAMARHVEAILTFQARGAVAFDYGNNLRAQAVEGGLAHDRAFSYPGFVPAFIRPLFCEGRGPFRWVALSGDPADIHRTDEVILREFADQEPLCRWIRLARDRIPFQGLPARICWLGYGERDRVGLIFNDLVRRGEIKAPIVIGRDHLDAGSVASPNRETEAMRDGSDAIADWPILNALVNTAAGATWVSFQHGGGVGIGYSLHAGMVVVADGTEDASWRLEHVLRTDPGTGVLRHADAGYPRAIEVAAERGLRIPVPPH